MQNSAKVPMSVITRIFQSTERNAKHCKMVKKVAKKNGDLIYTLRHLQDIVMRILKTCSECGKSFVASKMTNKYCLRQSEKLLASGLNIKNPINNLYYVFPLWNAKDLALRSKGNYNDWRNAMRYQLMIVDDLGTEPREVMEFGNVYTPLIDLITTRYEEQLFTIFTTNLTPAQLEEKYGKRIVDRINEMVEKVVFENESYRR